jgi:eukaryotic-like serine/threonine-protein kinase
MALTRRVWGAGKLLVLLGALVVTYLVFAAAAMRVALRASEVEVPDVRGRSVRDAATVLEEYGLTMRVDDNRRLHPSIPEGHVAQQDPVPGSTARRQRSIKLWLSAGGQVATVPDIVGQTERTAQMLLQEDGLGVAGVAEIRSADHPTDAVVAQTPSGGARGHEVSLLVNRGESTATYVMPDLIGVNGERAAEFLRVRGFRVAVVGNHPYPGVPSGVVIRQTPAGGFQVAPGEAISLEVSQ